MGVQISTILSLLVSNRDTIRRKLQAMGLKLTNGNSLPDNATLEQVADAANNIDVYEGDGELLTPSKVGEKGYKITPKYFKNESYFQVYVDNTFAVNAVTPNNKIQTISVDDAYMREVKVNPVPSEDVSVAPRGLIATKAQAATEPKILLKNTTDNENNPAYLRYVTFDKVVVDSKDVNSSTLYDGTSGNLVIKATDDGCTGYSQVTIPKPNVITEYNGYSLGLLDLDIDTNNDSTAEDTVITLPNGYYHGASITIGTEALYNALAAL